MITVVATALLAGAEDLPSSVAEAAAARALAREPAVAVSEGGGQPLEGAVDPAVYVLGPGDVLEVVYTGSSHPTERVRVSPSGRINLGPTGPVAVAGLNLAGAEAHIRSVLSRYYADTEISVDLLRVRSFRVHLVGHVAAPGAHVVTSASRASDLLESPGVLDPEASVRNLVLRHRDGREVVVDLTRYRRLGDLAANPYLEDGDVLLAQARRDSVSVFGYVARPGFIEHRAGDTMDDLVALAGGLTVGADARNVELIRVDPGSVTVAERRSLDLEFGEGSLASRPGDALYVRLAPDWKRERLVELLGEVRYPGVYAIDEERETLSSLIERAGGFTEDADPKSTRVFRPGVFERPEDDPEYQRLQVMPINEMTGEEYEYLKLRSRQRQGLASAMLSLQLEDPESGESLLLRSGDRIFVPRRNLAVDVQGAVKNPGFVPYEASRTMEDYISLAGGISDRARTGKTRIIRYRTGERVKANGDTRIDPGDTVWVPEKPDRDWWKITRETATFLVQIATLILIYDSAKN